MCIIQCAIYQLQCFLYVCASIKYSKVVEWSSVSNEVLSSYGVIIFLSCSSSHSFVAFPSPPL